MRSPNDGEVKVSIELRESERLDASYTIMARLVNTQMTDAEASMTNLSRGGLCFVSNLKLQQGDKVDIGLPANQPVATLKVKVIWCRPQRNRFSVGAEFIEMSAARRARIIEMHQAIGAYQKMNGSSVDPQQAAADWLRLHAESFLAGTP